MNELADRLYSSLVGRASPERVAHLLFELRVECDIDVALDTAIEVLESIRKMTAWSRTSAPSIYVQQLSCRHLQQTALVNQVGPELAGLVIVFANACLNGDSQLVRNLAPVWMREHDADGLRDIVVAAVVVSGHLVGHIMDGTAGAAVVD